MLCLRCLLRTTTSLTFLLRALLSVRATQHLRLLLTLALLFTRLGRLTCVDLCLSQPAFLGDTASSFSSLCLLLLAVRTHIAFDVLTIGTRRLPLPSHSAVVGSDLLVQPQLQLTRLQRTTLLIPATAANDTTGAWAGILRRFHRPPRLRDLMLQLLLVRLLSRHASSLLGTLPLTLLLRLLLHLTRQTSILRCRSRLTASLLLHLQIRLHRQLVATTLLSFRCRLCLRRLRSSNGGALRGLILLTLAATRIGLLVGEGRTQDLLPLVQVSLCLLACFLTFIGQPDHLFRHATVLLLLLQTLPTLHGDVGLVGLKSTLCLRCLLRTTTSLTFLLRALLSVRATQHLRLLLTLALLFTRLGRLTCLDLCLSQPAFLGDTASSFSSLCLLLLAVRTHIAFCSTPHQQRQT